MPCCSIRLRQTRFTSTCLHCLPTLTWFDYELKALACGILSPQVSRAQAVLAACDVLDIQTFVTAEDVVSGHSRLNLAFVASLFNKYVCLLVIKAVLTHQTAIDTARHTAAERG